MMANSKIEKLFYCYKICFLQCFHNCRALSASEIHIRLSGKQQPCDFSGHFNGRGLLPPERWETVVKPVQKNCYGMNTHITITKWNCEFVFIVRSDIFRVTDITLHWKIKYGRAFQNGLFCLSSFHLTPYQDHI